MIRTSYEVTPGVVYHAELEGELWPRERASEAEIAAMRENDPDPVQTPIEWLWTQETKRARPIIHDLHVPRVGPDLGCAGQVVPMRITVAKLTPADRGSALAREVVRSTWNHWVSTEDERGVRSLSATARFFGISIPTCRQRLNTYKKWAAEAAGIDPATIDRKAGFGRFASKSHRRAA